MVECSRLLTSRGKKNNQPADDAVSCGWFGLRSKVYPKPEEPISFLSNVLQEAKLAFSVFFSVLFLSAVSYAALNLQLSFLFLTKPHHLVGNRSITHFKELSFCLHSL
jgi:hypothetical protein